MSKIRIFAIQADNKARLNRTKYLLLGMGVAAVLTTFSVVAVYILFFHGIPVSNDPGEWGQFGDYFGGILNPLVGLFGVIGLLWTIYQNQFELSETREQLAISANEMKEQREISRKQEIRMSLAEQKQELLAAIKITIDSIEGDWHRPIPHAHLNESLLAYTSTYKNLNIFLDSGLGATIARKTAISLQDLHELLNEYINLSGSTAVCSSMISRVREIVFIMGCAKLIDEETLRFFYEPNNESSVSSQVAAQ